MKKTNKKINKFLKVILILCMIFSQLASPISVLADQIVPSYNLDMTLDTENNKFVVTSNGTEVLVEEENYILEVIRSFKYADGTLNEEETKTIYSLELGSSLNAGVDIEHETFSSNGVSYIDVNVYEVTDETIDISTYPIEDYATLLTTDKVEKIMNTSFEEGISYNNTALTFVITGEGIVCDNTEGYKCTFTKNEVNSKVIVSYVLETGDLNPNKEYHIVLKVNDVVTDLVTKDINTKEDLELDFSKLLPGVYSIEYEVRNEENEEVISSVVEFTYNNEEELDKVEFIKNAEFSEEIFYSYTTLTDEEKQSLGNEYKFLDNPLAFIFDNLASNENIKVNYNLFDEDTRYHVITSEKLLGYFQYAEDTLEEDKVDAYTVKEFLDELKIELPQTTVSIVDANGNVVDGDAYIQNGMKLVVNILGEKLEYDFLVYADVDGGLVEESDLSALVEKVLNDDFSYYDTYNLDLNGDEVIDVKDISLLGVNIYDGKYSSYEIEITDTITSVIESDKDELYAGESFEVILSLEGFENDYINALDGVVTFDENVLKLTKVECLDELFLGNNVNNKFIYATTETYDLNNETLVKLTFETLTEGVHKVSVNSMNLLADGVLVATIDSNELEITVNRALHTDASLKSLISSVGRFNKAFDSEVLEYTLYVDSYVSSVTLSGELNDEYAITEDFKTYILTGDNTQISINVTAEDGTVKTYRVNVVKVYKSSNNNLSSLIIDGYEIEFDKNTLEYKITVDSDVTSLDISAIVEHYGAWAKIEGNENFKEGENTVAITVYAENGTSKTYKLLVDKKAAAPAAVEEPEEDTNSVDGEKIVIIILIVLVVVGLLYLILKKDEDVEPRIEQIPPKKQPEPVKIENKNVPEKNNSNNNENKNKKKHKK